MSDDAGRQATARRRRAYFLSWEAAQDRRCLVCGRWLSEGTTSGTDPRRRWRWCEPCAVARDRRRLETKVWAALASARSLTLSGAA